MPPLAPFLESSGITGPERRCLYSFGLSPTDSSLVGGLLIVASHDWLKTRDCGQPFTYLADYLTKKASHLTYILLYMTAGSKLTYVGG